MARKQDFAQELLEDLIKERKGLKSELKQPKASLKVVPEAKEPSVLKSKEDSIELKKKDSVAKSKAASQKNSMENASLLQVQLLQSESLRLAQERIISLEKELQELRENNEALASAGDVFEEKIEQLLLKNEELLKEKEEGKDQFKDEKQILTEALKASRKEKEKLDAHNKELGNRLSKDLQSIRGRENSLENRIEIIKMESSVLQREKDKKILSLQKSIHKLDNNSKQAYKKNQKTQEKIKNLQDNSRKTIAVLRATIHNLEGSQSQETTEVSIKEEDSD